MTSTMIISDLFHMNNLSSHAIPVVFPPALMMVNHISASVLSLVSAYAHIISSPLISPSSKPLSMFPIYVSFGGWTNTS